ETSAVAAAILWFISARIRLRKRNLAKRGLGSGVDDPRALLRMVYEQSQWSAWAALPPDLLLYSLLPMALPGRVTARLAVTPYNMGASTTKRGRDAIRALLAFCGISCLDFIRATKRDGASSHAVPL